MSQFFVNSPSSGNLPPDVPLQFTTDSGIAVPAANNLNVLGADGATTSGSGSTITITVVNSGFPWSEESISYAAEVQHGYFLNAALTATLPTTIGPPVLALGNTIIFYVDTAGAVVIQAQADQRIQVGNEISALGGTSTSTQQGDMLELIFKPSDSTWHAITSVGSWTTV